MCRVVYVPVRPELGLDVLVTQDSHLRGEVFPVRTQQAAVEGDGRQQGHHGRRPQTVGAGGGRGGLGEVPYG